MLGCNSLWCLLDIPVHPGKSDRLLVELAGEHADTFALRGYDSVQLAAACVLQTQAQEAVHFACFDKRLRNAAKILGMSTWGG